jgi:hypothetical protein
MKAGRIKVNREWETNNKVWYNSPAYQDGYNGGIYYGFEYGCWICAFDKGDEEYGESIDEETQIKLTKQWENGPLSCKDVGFAFPDATVLPPKKKLK